MDGSAKVAPANLPGATTSASGVVELATDGETASGVVVQGNDARLSNARTPSAHKASHEAGGGDELHVDTIGAGTDVTTNNATTSKHGLLKKLSNVSTEYMNGVGNWATPPDTGEVNTMSNLTGTAGAVGIYKQKTTVNFEMKKINAGSSKVTITDDTGNNEVDIDVAQGNLSLSSIGGTATWSQVSKTGSILDDIADVTITSGAANEAVVRNSGNTAWINALLVNANISGSAAIAYSKLNLSGAILNADVNASAAIAYSKLNLATSIVNADVSASAAIAKSKLASLDVVNADVNAAAAIAYSKLNLAGSIVNADVASGAAIAKTKLASLDIVNADVNASAAIAYSKLNLGTSIVNADVSGSAAIAYSKLNLGTSIVNADIAVGAAIVYSKLALTTSIVNGDINASAAIAWSKISKTGSSIFDLDDINGAGIADGDILIWDAGASEFIVGAQTGGGSVDLEGLTDVDLTTPAQYQVLQYGAGTDWVNGLITNNNVSGSAAIAKSKLASLDVVNADVNASAAIAYSKLNLGTSIVNADISGSAAIAKSKLAALAIVNADVDASAAIVYSKLALTGGIINTDVNASAAIAYSKLNLATSIVNADVNASAAIAYSKLNLATSIVNADVSGSAAIAKSKLASLAIVDADVSAHTSSKITITTKAQLNSAILYSDVDNALGAHYVDVTKMTAPSNPGANDLRLYVDTTDTHLKFRNNGGTVVNLSNAGGDATLAGTQTFTGAKSFDLQITPKEIAAPSSPSAGYQSLYIDSTSHKLTRKNSSGTVTMLEGMGVAEAKGVSTQSGNASTTSFNIAHGLGSTPSWASCEGSSDDARSGFSYTYDSTNIVVVFPFPPPNTASNLVFQWRVTA